MSYASCDTTCRRLEIDACRRADFSKPTWTATTVDGPILRSPAAVGNGPNCDYGFLPGVDDREGKSPKQKPPGLVLTYRPPFGCLPNGLGSSVQFFDEVQSSAGA